MTAFTARIDRKTGDVTLRADGYVFGRLANCESCHVFVSRDEDLDERVNDALEGGIGLREMLSVVRRVYEALEAERAAEYRMEQRAEASWLRAAELHSY